MKDNLDFLGYNFEPETMQCGHLLLYACRFCKECYPCKHKVQQYGNGELWWKCRNGKKHRALGRTEVKT